MRRFIRYRPAGIVMLWFILAGPPDSRGEPQPAQWADPFPTVDVLPPGPPASLTFRDVALLIAQGNASLQAGGLAAGAANHETAQAGKWPNPELELEAENLGGDLDGLRQAEISLLLSQEFDIWGKRRAHKAVISRAGATQEYSRRLERYRIYAQAQYLFLDLISAQQTKQLAQRDEQLAAEIVQAAQARLDKGAGLRSESCLAETELERSRMALAAMETELDEAREHLSALWGNPRRDFQCSTDTTTMTIPDAGVLLSLVEESKDVLLSRLHAQSVGALLDLERVNWRPNPAVKGGYRHSEADQAGSFIVGLSFPLPVLDGNGHGRQALRIRQQAAILEEEQAKREAAVFVRTSCNKINQLRTGLATLDQTIIPKSEAAYQALAEAYHNGKIPITELLDSRRTIIELQTQRIDLVRTVRTRIIGLEEFLGIKLTDFHTEGK
jgi:cobalt-zinc-cadmium efflux system outer membrane protein